VVEPQVVSYCHPVSEKRFNITNKAGNKIIKKVISVGIAMQEQRQATAAAAASKNQGIQ
jgi:hypothetical protein